jgi:uncharacterized Tic20 family protein
VRVPEASGQKVLGKRFPGSLVATKVDVKGCNKTCNKFRMPMRGESVVYLRGMTQPPDPGPQIAYRNNAEKTWALVAHFGAVLGLAPALVVFLVKGDRSSTVRAHAVAALNFQIFVSGALVLLSIVRMCGPFLPSFTNWALTIVWIGVWGAGIAFGVVAGLRANEGRLYRYPIRRTVVG